MMRVCRKCGERLPNRIKINGQIKNIQRRQFCIKCSPWGNHNTKANLDPITPSGEKICCRCKQQKPISQFNNKSRARLHSYCKTCLYGIQKERWRQRKKDAVIYKGGKCSRCGYGVNFSALDFHHRNPEEKEYDWSRLRLRNIEEIKKELDKCEILCSNCHSEIHNPSCLL